METQKITVHVKMDYKTLRTFGLFDAFNLKGRWKKPAIFAAIMLAFSLLCFLQHGKQHSVLLGSVLLAIGLGLPLVYVVMFLSQLKAQAKKLRLNPPRRVYTLVFSDESIHVSNELKAGDEVTLEWQKLPVAFRRKKAIYLYVTRDRAFILPT